MAQRTMNTLKEEGIVVIASFQRSSVFSTPSVIQTPLFCVLLFHYMHPFSPKKR